MKASDVMADLVARLVAAIEAGADGWEMPWRTLAVRGWPTNQVTGVAYTGANTLLLHFAAQDSGYRTGRWATFKQWRTIDAQVRKGEHGTRAVRWVVKDHDRDNDSAETGDNDAEQGGQRRLIPVTFTVFNAAQVDGLADIDHDPAAVSDDRLAAWLAPIPARVIWGGNRACYNPNTDAVHMPRPEQFTDPDAVGATLAHELAHWTGHDDRLARSFGARFADDAYSVEELTAELSAAFTCASLGIAGADRSDDHATYLAHWCRVLTADPGVLWTVASRAQAATDYLTAYSTVPALVVAAS